MARVWVPYEDCAADLTGAGIDAAVFDGEGRLPELASSVEFLTVPYMKPPDVLGVANSMPTLQVVQTLTAGYEDILPYVPAGVTLCNARGVHDASTAELALALTLASLRGIPEFVRAQQSASWHHKEFPALADKVVLIVGYGSIGRAIEKRLHPFECEVVRAASRPRPADNVFGTESLPTILPSADVVVLATPLTPQTRHLVDEHFLSTMKSGSLLVNVARGGVVDTAALVAALQGRRVIAAVDVTDPEPLPPDHPLWQAPGLLLSPHVGGYSSAFLPRAKRLIGAQLERFTAGEPLANVVVAGSA